jgi:CheY-like chemotaxis protein
MPDIDGVQLAAEIRKKRPDLPILFMTGYADRDRLQGEAVVDKPFNLHVLLAALAERRRARH